MKSITFLALALVAVSWCQAEDDGQYHPHLYGDVIYRQSQDPYYRRLFDGNYGSIYKAYQPLYYQAPSQTILSPLQVKFGDSIDQVPFPTAVTYRNLAVPVVPTYRPIVYTTPKPVVSTYRPIVYTTPKPIVTNYNPIVFTTPKPVLSTYSPIVYTTPKPLVVAKSQPTVYLKSAPDSAASTLSEDRASDENNYRYAYETDNGIAVAESGTVDSSVNGQGGTRVSGFYEYVGDNGLKYRVDYTADENGYRASGAHLPKSAK